MRSKHNRMGVSGHYQLVMLRTGQRASGLLVSCLVLNAHIRAPQMAHSKARLAGNGRSLVKSRNAAVGHLWRSLRARL
jgi:hypothetical protein